MSRLADLYANGGQSPWLDNLKRDWITSGELGRWIDSGIRGLTSNPSIFEKAIAGSDAYDEQFNQLMADGSSVEDAYWELVASDIQGALGLLADVHHSSAGIDGYVSVEVAPDLAHETDATITAARALDERFSAPNLYVKVPGTAEGTAAIEQLISEGRSINVTLIFSLDRYGEVIEAYLSGLERCEGELSHVSSVASFFISRVDSEVDARLNEIDTPEALALRGKAAVAQGQLAYALFKDRFSGPRWDALVARGARVQRPLWASTSVKNDAYPDTLYVDTLIGPNTVNTMPDATIDAFVERGTVARTIDADPAAAEAIWTGLAEVGVDMADVAERLETEGVKAFVNAFDSLLATLHKRAHASPDDA